MSSTFVQMQNNIADYLNRTDLTSQIKTAINRAIEFYWKERLWFNETTNTLSTIANQQAYGTADGLPSTIEEIDDVKITLAASNIPSLRKRSMDYILSHNIGNYTNQPTDYAWYQSKLYLYPTPNAVWTLTIYHQKSYTALSADADTNDFTQKAEDLIEARAQWWLYKNILKDKNLADVAKEDEIEALMAHRLKTKNLLGTNQIKATSF
jgi:hypothetical protein